MQAQFNRLRSVTAYTMRSASAVKLVARLTAAIPQQPSLDTLILGLTQHSFVDCCRDPDYRKWLNTRPDIENRLCKKHIFDLMKLPEFRTDLADNGEKAVQYLAWLAKFHKKRTSVCSKRCESRWKECSSDSDSSSDEE